MPSKSLQSDGSSRRYAYAVVRWQRGNPRSFKPIEWLLIQEKIMAKVLVLYYSMYGHLETMASAVAEGARSVPGTDVTIKRVAETIPAEQAAAIGVKLDQKAPVATPDELAN